MSEKIKLHTYYFVEISQVSVKSNTAAITRESIVIIVLNCVSYKEKLYSRRGRKFGWYIWGRGTRKIRLRVLVAEFRRLVLSARMKISCEARQLRAFRSI